jgi:hypothetical protein
MRISDDLRQKVIFFGFGDPSAPAGITCVGTGFLVAYEDDGYLVTCGHVARPLEEVPFLIRVNRKDGGAQNIPVDGLKWFHHEDSSVDVSVAQMWLPRASDLACSYILAPNYMLDRQTFVQGGVGIGNATYTIGLFRLMHGQSRNLPIVHQGSIAMVPGDEKIPVRDWLAPRNVKRTRYVEGYLVEAQSLSGLSGSPVWVRPDYEMPGPPKTRAGARGVILLGLWQGAWDAPPDEVMAAEHGKEVRVPVGMGIVVPAHRILEVLEMPIVKAAREKATNDRAASSSARLDAAFPAQESTADSTDENPNHREAFDRLLRAAAKPIDK